MLTTLNQNGMGNISSPGSVEYSQEMNPNGTGKIVPRGSQLIKDSTLSESELNDLRETFKVQYATTMGWDPNNLTEEQLKEIFSHKSWQAPGLLLS